MRRALLTTFRREPERPSTSQTAMKLSPPAFLSDAHGADARSADSRPGLQRPELGAHGIVQTLDDGGLISVDRLVRQGPVFVAET